MPNLKKLKEKKEENKRERKLEDKQKFQFPKRKEDFNLFQIDFDNRKIRNTPSARIASDTRKFLKLHPDFLLSGVLEANGSTSSVAGNEVTTTLGNYEIPMNTISRNDSNNDNAGNVFRVRASGTYTTDDATATTSIILKVATTTFHTLTSTAGTVTNAPWMIDWTFIVTAIGSSGTAESYASAKINNVNKDDGSTGTHSIDTTSNLNIYVNGSWTDGSSGDSLTIRQFTVELLN